MKILFLHDFSFH